MNFYTRFAINSAISFVQALIATKGKLTDEQRAKALAFTQAGAEFLNSVGRQ